MAQFVITGIRVESSCTESEGTTFRVLVCIGTEWRKVSKHGFGPGAIWDGYSDELGPENILMAPIASFS